MKDHNSTTCCIPQGKKCVNIDIHIYIYIYIIVIYVYVYALMNMHYIDIIMSYHCIIYPCGLRVCESEGFGHHDHFRELQESRASTLWSCVGAQFLASH